jgi:hypothetical protein
VGRELLPADPGGARLSQSARRAREAADAPEGANLEILHRNPRVARAKLPPEVVREIESRLGDLMGELGYSVATSADAVARCRRRLDAEEGRLRQRALDLHGRSAQRGGPLAGVVASFVLPVVRRLRERRRNQPAT